MEMKKLKKEKRLPKLIKNSDSDSGDNSEHELSYYIKDRVRLMKEVLKIIKPRKIISMAPECMKHMDKDEINSILLEELLGISNKRLKYIFEGKNFDEESSSSEDDQPIDVISLDDISSDDDFINISDEEEHEDTNQKRKHAKDYLKKAKKEKIDKQYDNSTKKRDKYKSKREPMDEENLMSVLELLELQARARAIRSQLELENRKKKQEQEVSVENKLGCNNDDDEIIIEVPKEEEIIINSSDSENDEQTEHQQDNSKTTEINIITESLSSQSSSCEIIDNAPISDNLQCKSFNTGDHQSDQGIQLQDTNPEISEQTSTESKENKDDQAEVPNINEIVSQDSTEALTCFNSSDSAQESKKEQNSKKMRHIINRYQSYKKDLIGDETVCKSEHFKTEDQKKKVSVEENDDLVINIDQDDLDCIICD